MNGHDYARPETWTDEWLESSETKWIPCDFPGCVVSARPAEFARHCKIIHTQQKNSVPSDYPRCAKSHDSFTRNEHFRDHLKVYHKEDIGRAKGDEKQEKRKWQPDQQRWLAMHVNRHHGSIAGGYVSRAIGRIEARHYSDGDLRAIHNPPPSIFPISHGEQGSGQRSTGATKIAIVGSERFLDTASHEKLWELLETESDIHIEIFKDRFDVDAKSHFDLTAKTRNTTHIPYGYSINTRGLFHARVFNMPLREAVQNDPTTGLSLSTLEKSGLLAVDLRCPWCPQSVVGSPRMSDSPFNPAEVFHGHTYELPRQFSLAGDDLRFSPGERELDVWISHCASHFPKSTLPPFALKRLRTRLSRYLADMSIKICLESSYAPARCEYCPPERVKNFGKILARIHRTEMYNSQSPSAFLVRAPHLSAHDKLTILIVFGWIDRNSLH